jgi:hypothetical protein
VVEEFVERIAGVVITPADEMVVVPVCPTAKVLAERFVVEAFAKTAVPVKVGEVEKTSEPPEPVRSETMAKSFAEVSMEVVASLALKVLQSVAVKRPRDVADAEGRLKVCTPPAEVTEKSVPVVEEAKVCDDWVWPLREVSAPARSPSVLVETH